VDYEEQGISYFIGVHTSERLSNFYEWSDHYTPETKVAQISLARLAHLRSLALEIWLPGGLALAGLFFLALALFRGNERRQANL
jgi:hypothetical protein